MRIFNFSCFIFFQGETPSFLLTAALAHRHHASMAAAAAQLIH
jgi:hypothetical protein